MNISQKVSVIIPVYNVSDYIERCADSLFTQSAGDVEYIFVNDCTPDNSLDVLRRVMMQYPHRISQVKIIDHESNRGVSAARNTGLKAAEGEWVCFVDADDYVEPGYIENFISRSPEADLCLCGFVSGAVSYRLPDRMYDRENLSQCIFELEEQCLLGFVNKCFRMDIIRQHHLCFNEAMKFWEDLVFILNYLMFSKKIRVTGGVLYHYEDRPGSAIKQPIPFESIMGYLDCVGRFLLPLQGAEYMPDIGRQVFRYIMLSINSLYVDTRVSKENRLSFLSIAEKVMRNCPPRFSDRQPVSYKIVYRVLLLKSIRLKDSLLSILGYARKINLKFRKDYQ